MPQFDDVWKSLLVVPMALASLARTGEKKNAPDNLTLMDAFHVLFDTRELGKDVAIITAGIDLVHAPAKADLQLLLAEIQRHVEPLTSLATLIAELQNGIGQPIPTEVPTPEQWEQLSHRQVAYSHMLCNIAEKAAEGRSAVEHKCIVLADRLRAFGPSGSPNPATPAELSDGITVSEAARRTGIAKGPISDAATAGKIANNGRTGLDRRVNAASVDEWARDRAKNPGSPVRHRRNASGAPLQFECKGCGEKSTGEARCPKCGGNNWTPSRRKA